MSRRFLAAIPIAVLVIGGSTACATKKMVRTSVGEVNEKVTSLGRSVEATQERTRENEGRNGDELTYWSVRRIDWATRVKAFSYACRSSCGATAMQ